VWREDDAPLRGLVRQYARRREGDSPIAQERARARELADMQRALVGALPRARRPGARLVLGLAARRIPLRGVAKRSFLQAIDIARAAARRVGSELVAGGRLADAADVFMLTGEELLGPLPRDLDQLVSRRHATRAAYQELVFATTEWQGLPQTIRVGSEPEASASDVICGTGVSSGVVEGTVRVVSDPSFSDVEPDEILVAPTTDPSWSSIMFISSALVVDLGGALSHAAVVARELRIPCVVGTRNATRILSTGDRVRVDGSAGTVEVLERA
jgi:pyruvate,water dikinase